MIHKKFLMITLLVSVAAQSVLYSMPNPNNIDSTEQKSTTKGWLEWASEGGMSIATALALFGMGSAIGVVRNKNVGEDKQDSGLGCAVVSVLLFGSAVVVGVPSALCYWLVKKQTAEKQSVAKEQETPKNLNDLIRFSKKNT